MFVKDNKVKTLRAYLVEALNSRYDKDETNAIVWRLFEHFKGWERTDVVMHLNDGLTESELLKFHFALKRLRKGEPLQYVLGETTFMGLNIKVGPEVLIPRPETEELVKLIIDDTVALQPVIVDWCTGSGCIAIALKSAIPDSTIYALEKSTGALEIAKENAQANNLEIDMLEGDILEENPWQPEDQLDIVVSNPPYVAEGEKESMEQHVLEHEPSIALFVPDDDPLLFYRALGQWGLKTLKNGGYLYLEIDRNQHDELISLLRSMGYSHAEAFRDLNGNWRIIRARK